MTQAQLDRQIAAATGDSRRTIARLGFSIVAPAAPRRARPVARKFLDWDRVARRRYLRVAVH